MLSNTEEEKIINNIQGFCPLYYREAHVIFGQQLLILIINYR